MKVVLHGLKKPWWKPLDDDLKRHAESSNGNKPPLTSSVKSQTGEGTRYGKRAKTTTKAVAKQPRKPQQ